MKKYIILTSSILFINCLNPDCNENKRKYVQNDCIIILERDYASSNVKQVYLKLRGVNPESGEFCECEDTGRDWGRYQNYMDKGDTFTKRKGNNFFTLHKKDTILRFEWGDCDENNEFIIPENNPPQIRDTVNSVIIYK